MAATNINTGTGYAGAVNVPVAIDTVSAEQYQKIKIDVGAAGVSVPFSDLISGGALKVTGGGGGTEYTEGDTDATITGSVMMMEGAANAVVPAQGTAADGLLVNLGSNNDVRITDGTDIAAVVPLGTAVVAANPGIVTNTVIHGLNSGGGGAYVDVKVNPSGALVTEATLAANSGVDVGDVTINNAAGASAVNIQDGGNSITVDGTVAFSNTTIAVTNAGTFAVQSTSVVPGTGATNLGKAEDAAHSSSDVGVMMLAVRTDVPTTATSATGDYAALTTDKENNLRVTSPLSGPGTIDTFGALMTSMRNPQINVQFHTSAPSLLTTVTTTGSGSATTSNGGALFATGATPTSSAKSVSLTNTRYTPGGEIYALVTAGFLNGGGATNYQRIGLYDDNNGIFIGYENNSFGVTTRSAGVDTSVAIASWNGDTLTGAAGSKFTRNGTPEAVNLAYVNVWRFRFGWLGEAPVLLEILSPDGHWVTCHTIKQPNTAATPSFRTPVLPITCHVNKTGGATDYQIQTFCWGAGSTMIGMESDDVVMQNAASATGNGTAMSCIGYGTAVLSLTGTFSATVTFEGTTDGTNWSAVSATQIGGSDIANTATTTGLYRIAAAGLDQVRARISAYTSGNVTIIGHATNAMMSSKVVRLASGTNAIGKLAANDGVDIGDVTINNTTLPVVGAAAHDAAISGNPVRIAGRAATAEITAVAAGDTCDLLSTVTGKLVTSMDCLPGQRWSATGELTSTTAVMLKAAGAAGVKNIITYVKIVNSNGTTATKVDIYDGANGSGGTVIWTGWAEENGGGEAGNIPPKAGTAATLLEIKEATATTTNGVFYYVAGYTTSE